MSATAEKVAPATPRAAKIGMGIGGGAVAMVAVVGGITAAFVVFLAFLGTPLFAVMGGSAEILWLLHPDQSYHHLRFIAPTVLDERFADSPILVTIPLFTFVGYVLAEAKTPDRLVAAARTVLGWMPGGLAIVAVIASAVFTVLTGGSGVTIIAIGGLLYPALRKQKYSEKFALGLVTTGGSVGLLLPMYVLPLLVVARVSSRANAYYYVTWMLCSVFFVVSPAISSALFAEGSHDPASVRAIARRSIVITSGLLAPVGLGYILLGPLVLRVFGPAYAANGTTLLLILVASAPFEAVNNIYVSVLRVERRLVRAAVLTAGMAGISLVLAWVLLPTMGIDGAGVAWLISQFVGMITTLASVLIFDRPRTVAGSRGTHGGALGEEVAPRVLDPAS